MHSKIFLNFNPKISSPKPHQVTRGGTEHANISFSFHGVSVDMRHVPCRLRHMREARCLQPLQYLVCSV